MAMWSFAASGPVATARGAGAWPLRGDQHDVDVLMIAAILARAGAVVRPVFHPGRRDVPFIHLTVKGFRGRHPEPVVRVPEKPTLSIEVLTALGFVATTRSAPWV